MTGTTNPGARGGARIPAQEILAALTRGPLTYRDGASQVFTDDGRTSFLEGGRQTVGEWGVDENGRFWSFWPPSYRAVYDVDWIVGPGGEVVGVRFTDVDRGSTSEGRYAAGSTR